jgi:hypothetical protein
MRTCLVTAEAVVRDRLHWQIAARILDLLRHGNGPKTPPIRSFQRSYTAANLYPQGQLSDWAIELRRVDE